MADADLIARLKSQIKEILADSARPSGRAGGKARRNQTECSFTDSSSDEAGSLWHRAANGDYVEYEDHEGLYPDDSCFADEYGGGRTRKRKRKRSSKKTAFFDDALVDGVSPLEQTAEDASTLSNRAFSKIVDLVNRSDRSEKSLRDKLSACGYSEEIIDEALSRAKNCFIVDDMRFADVLVRSRISQGKGRCGIERELKTHAIDPFEIPGWPESYNLDYDTELDRALRVLDARPPRSKNLREGAYRKLGQRGFDASVCSSAARIWCELHTDSCQ